MRGELLPIHLCRLADIDKSIESEGEEATERRGVNHVHG